MVIQARSLRFAAIALPAAAAGIYALTAHAAPQAGKIMPWAAMRIATGRTGGRAVSATYEMDEGHWIYGVIVVANHELKEVELDPITGKIGDTESITPDGEAKEYRAELAAALSGKRQAPEQGEKGEKD